MSLWRRLRYWCRCLLARNPRIFFSYYRFTNKRRQLVRPSSDIVIEGFPRSGNTFAVLAFLHANPGARVANHMHAQAQVMRAAQLELPCIVLIRKPDDAVRSLLVRHPYIGAELALRSYTEFYQDLRSLSGSFVLASFEEVTADFGAVVERVNARFGTTFTPFHHTPGSTAEIFAAMDRYETERYGRVEISHVARPSAGREALKSSLSLSSAKGGLPRATDEYAHALSSRNL